VGKDRTRLSDDKKRKCHKLKTNLLLKIYECTIANIISCVRVCLCVCACVYGRKCCNMHNAAGRSRSVKLSNKKKKIKWFLR
jgi:hypothetical protein